MAKATKKQQHQAKVNQLDNLGTNASEFIFEDELTMIETLAGEFIKRVKTNLEEADMIVTGKIADLTIERTLDGFDITANKWLVYQDKGVNGAMVKKYDTPFSFKDKKPPVQPFINWIKAQNIQLKDNAKYYGQESAFKELSEMEQIERVAYAIREKVYKEGLKPRNVYSKEIPRLIDELTSAVANLTINTIFRDN